MDGRKREPLTEDQLSALLKQWAVAAPPDLEKRVMAARADTAVASERRSWWRFLLKGYIRLPMPVACCVAILLIALVWRSAVVGVTCSAANGGFHAAQSITATSAEAGQPAASAVVCPVNSKC